DATVAADVARVMGEEKADAVQTDPPYGQNQEGGPHDEPETLPALLRETISALPIRNAIVVAFASPRTFPVWLDAIRQKGHHFERMLWLSKKAQIARPWRGWIMKS